MERKAPGAFVSLLKQRCPNCRKAHPFLYPTYSSRFLAMHDSCPACGMNFEPEPGFYWGAMYITYGMNAGLLIVYSVVLFLFFDYREIMGSLLKVILPILVLNLLLVPVMFKYSRLILLYLLGRANFKEENYQKATENSTA